MFTRFLFCNAKAATMAKHLHRNNQILTALLKNQPLPQNPPLQTQPWTPDTVSETLSAIPKLFFLPHRSLGRQISRRHRSPLKQRRLRLESFQFHHHLLLLGPAAHRNLEHLNLAAQKALQFFHWLESLGFIHTEKTTLDTAIVLAKSNQLNSLWDFLKKRASLVTVKSVTCLIKCLGEEGLANEALTAFYRMKQLHLKPDVYAYNTLIYALCGVGNFKKARFLLEQMELPGFRCPPDVYTYTILISSYCRHGMETGCRKATRRRIWEANHMFRNMVFRGFVPDVVTYNALINGCCKTYRIERALELFEDMNKRDCKPNMVTYNSFVRYYAAVNEIDKAVDMLRRMQSMNHGMATTSSYTPIIHSLCEAGKGIEARDFLVELVDGGSIPREYTYKMVCNALHSAGADDLLDGGMRRRVEEGMRMRYKHIMKVKPIMTRRGYDSMVVT